MPLLQKLSLLNIGMVKNRKGWLVKVVEITNIIFSFIIFEHFLDNFEPS